MQSRSTPLFRGLVAAAGLAIAIVVPAAAQDPAEDVVLATVNGEDVMRSEVLDEIRALGPQAQGLPPDFLIPQLLERVIDRRLLQQRALDEGFADDPEVTEIMDSLRPRVIQQVFVQRLSDEAATDDAVFARYEATIGAQEPSVEINARHILVETEEEAVAVITELDGGADFATLAQERSTGPSGPRGGDLGYFARDAMVPEFGEAAFAMDVGSHSAAPVQTQFGWHVIKVEDRRDVQPPTLEESADEIRNALVQEFLSQYVSALRAEAEIVIPEAEASE